MFRTLLASCTLKKLNLRFKLYILKNERYSDTNRLVFTGR